MTSKSEKEVVYLPGGNGAEPGAEQELLPALDDMTPREIVLELDKYIVGQAAAKRAVAVALRNRVRRQKLPPEIAEDVLPKNILMIGPTGARKTPHTTPRRQAGPAHGGSRGPRARHAFVRNRLQSGRRGDGHRQDSGHVLRHVRPAKEKAQNERGRRVRVSDPGRREQAAGH